MTITDATPRSDGNLVLSFGAVILAAGASSRMGKPKLVLPWGRTSILGHLMNQWQKLGANQIAVVCAAGDQAIRQELDRLVFPERDRILNPAPERGMFSSIQCAATWAGWSPTLTQFAIVLGDQPHLRQETLRALMEFAAANPEKVCQAGRNGRPRHPVIIPRPTLERLKVSGVETLKQFLHTEPALLCDMDDPGLDCDIDRPEDYEKAVPLFLKRV